MKYKEVLPLKPTVTVSIVYFNELQMLCTLSSNGDIFRSALSACSCCWYHVDTDHSSNYSWMNHSTVTCYSFFFFLYPGNACAILNDWASFHAAECAQRRSRCRCCLFRCVSAVCDDFAWKPPQGRATPDVIAEAAGGNTLLRLWGQQRQGKKKLDSVTLKRIYSVVFFYFELKPNAEYFPDTLFWGRCDHTKEFCFEFVEEK